VNPTKFSNEAQMHTMKNGRLCGLSDDHNGQHLSPEALKRHEDDKRDRLKAYDDKARERVFNHYGHECAYAEFGNCSGEIEIDHMDGTLSTVLYSASNRHGNKLYRALVKNCFPQGFQPLCRYHNRHKGWLTDSEYRLIMALRITGEAMGNTEGTKGHTSGGRRRDYTQAS
jgi:hypothetical protein